MSPKSAAWLSGLFVYFFLLGTACLLRPPAQVLNEAFLLTFAALVVAALLLVVAMLLLGCVLGLGHAVAAIRDARQFPGLGSKP